MDSINKLTFGRGAVFPGLDSNASWIIVLEEYILSVENEGTNSQMLSVRDAEFLVFQ
jgi:hypothetical protein